MLSKELSLLVIIHFSRKVVILIARSANKQCKSALAPCNFANSDIDDLVAFLASLTSTDYNTPVVRAWARQHALAHTNRPHRDPTRACGPKPVTPRLPKP